jgi:hypothetical protein
LHKIAAKILAMFFLKNLVAFSQIFHSSKTSEQRSLSVILAFVNEDPDSQKNAPDPEHFKQVFRIRMIHKFLGLPDPDLLVRGTDLDLSIIQQN